jgi:hypothetical protein
MENIQNKIKKKKGFEVCRVRGELFGVSGECLIEP